MDPRDPVSWEAYMYGEQVKLRQGSLTHKEVYLGVEVRRRSQWDALRDVAEPVLRRFVPAALDEELASLDEEISNLDAALARDGLEGQPATPEQMRWLFERSIGLGLSPKAGESEDEPGAAPNTWESADLPALEVASLEQEPFSPSVHVRGRGAYAGRDAHTIVLSVGPQTGNMEIPQSDQPWMTWGDKFPFALEWSLRLRVRTNDEVLRDIQHQARKVSAQQDHYDEHNLTPPQQLSRQGNIAPRVEDELTSGSPHARRVVAWARVAVSAPTEKEVSRRAERLEAEYKRAIRLEHPDAQWMMAREFIPGQPLATSAYQRHASVLWAAAGAPTASSQIGDQDGVLVGNTTTTSRAPVIWDMWASQEERDGSGLTATVAGLGGGKTFLNAGLIAKSARAGSYWTILDPSGPLAALTEVPELRPYTRSIDLLNGQPGILNPYRVIPEPKREDFSTDAAWQQERAQAHAMRRKLVEETLLVLLPWEIQQQPDTGIVLLTAIRAVGDDPAHSPDEVLAELGRMSRDQHYDLAEHAGHVLIFLEDRREQIRLLIPNDAEVDPYEVDRDDRINILTMPGLTLPKQGTPKSEWTRDEAIHVQLLHLAAWLTQRSVYNQPKTQRKGVFIDEAFFLTEVPTGKTLMNRLARDSRKWNVRVLLSSQVPEDFLKINGIVSLLDSVFVGRLTGEEQNELQDALRLLKVPVGVGYERLLESLSRKRSKKNAKEKSQGDTDPREFIFADGQGGIERIRVDFSGDHLLSLRKALYTSPGEQATSSEDSPAQVVETNSEPTDRDTDRVVQTDVWLEDEIDREATQVLYPATTGANGSHPDGSLR